MGGVTRGRLPLMVLGLAEEFSDGDCDTLLGLGLRGLDVAAGVAVGYEHPGKAAVVQFTQFGFDSSHYMFVRIQSIGFLGF